MGSRIPIIIDTRVAVERKSVPDFISTVIRIRKRFHTELRKLAGYDFVCVVVERSLRDVLDGINLPPFSGPPKLRGSPWFGPPSLCRNGGRP